MSSDPRRNLPSTASSYAARHTTQDDLTWLDFLRTAGGTVPTDPRLSASGAPALERTDSADRKRRHTGTETERRDHPYPYNARSVELHHRNSSNNATPQPGSSRATAIDLTSPARPPRPGFSNLNRPSDPRLHPTRRESDVALPRWQPDGEVTECPVCHTDFSWLFRRHHCRKCGRVVCANCSPHRITIPRQYIVQPPAAAFEDEANPCDSPPQGRANPALGGGEIVRVCNPCVPDPWMPNPVSAASAPAPAPVPPPPAPSHRDVPTHAPNRDPRVQLSRDPRQSLRVGAERERSDRYRLQPAPDMAASRVRSHSHQLASNAPPAYGVAMMNSISTSAGQDSSYPRIPQRYAPRYSQSGGVHGVPHIGSAPTIVPAATTPAPQPSQPRREVREEDECPVCGTEMPPGEDVREAHIQECIASRFSSTPSQPSRSAPPTADTAVPPPPAPGTSAPSTSTPPVPEGSRPRATSYRPRGMALYRATEKDCTTEDGEAQECVICFEEFQPGDEMGRMECLCKFHRLCIRQWWDTKGAGSCPTHQLHD